MVNHTLMSGNVILNRASRKVNAFVEVYDDGMVRAGYYKDTAKVYGTAEEAQVRFMESFQFSRNQSAWEIANALETYIQQRDDGR